MPMMRPEEADLCEMEVGSTWDAEDSSRPTFGRGSDVHPESEAEQDKTVTPQGRRSRWEEDERYPHNIMNLFGKASMPDKADVRGRGCSLPALSGALARQIRVCMAEQHWNPQQWSVDTAADDMETALPQRVSCHSERDGI